MLFRSQVGIVELTSNTGGMSNFVHTHHTLVGYVAYMVIVSIIVTALAVSTHRIQKAEHEREEV